MGDKICNWIEAEFPFLVRWIGGMGEWEAVAFGVGLLVFGYLIYIAAYNVYLTAIGYEDAPERENYPWVDADYHEL